MLLTCIDNRAVTLSDHQFPRGAVEHSTYPITRGRQYLVLGMLLWENTFYFLVPDDWGGPCYVPAGLFDLGTWQIPDAWLFSLESGIRASGKAIWTDPCAAKWGYDEFVNDPDHGSDLAEREESALEIFKMRLTQAQSSLASHNDTTEF